MPWAMYRRSNGMKTNDPTIRRRMLRPLLRRRITPGHDKNLDRALTELEERALAASLLPSMAAAQKQARQERSAGHWKDPSAAKAMVEFAFVLYLARRVSLQEYTFLVAQAAEVVHDGRIDDQQYSEIRALSDAMHAIEVAHGLKPNEYWLKNDAPPEWRALSAKWDAAAVRRLSETFVELEDGKVSVLFAQERTEFERLRERGRRAFFHKGELVPSLADTVKRYEIEARAAAAHNAYTAAVTMMGAALEGLLLLRCLRSPVKASRTAQDLPPKKRPKTGSSPSMWTFDTLICVCLSAGWLPAIEMPNMSASPAGLANLLRQMRNNIHPGRVCTERPWVEAERRDFEDAEVIYTTLFATVFQGRLLKALKARPSEHAA